MNGLSELIDSLEVKFFKLNQKLLQLEKKVYSNPEYVKIIEKSQQKIL